MPVVLRQPARFHTRTHAVQKFCLVCNFCCPKICKYQCYYYLGTFIAFMPVLFRDFAITTTPCRIRQVDVEGVPCTPHIWALFFSSRPQPHHELAAAYTLSWCDHVQITQLRRVLAALLWVNRTLMYSRATSKLSSSRQSKLSYILAKLPQINFMPI